MTRSPQWLHAALAFATFEPQTREQRLLEMLQGRLRNPVFRRLV